MLRLLSQRLLSFHTHHHDRVTAEPASAPVCSGFPSFAAVCIVEYFACEADVLLLVLRMMPGYLQKHQNLRFKTLQQRFGDSNADTDTFKQSTVYGVLGG